MAIFGSKAAPKVVKYKNSVIAIQLKKESTMLNAIQTNLKIWFTKITFQFAVIYFEKCAKMWKKYIFL